MLWLLRGVIAVQIYTFLVLSYAYTIRGGARLRIGMMSGIAMLAEVFCYTLCVRKRNQGGWEA